MAPRPFVPLADGAQVEISYILGLGIVENRLFFVKRNPPFTSGDLQDLADGVEAWHSANILPLLSSAVNARNVVVTDWTAPFGSLTFSSAAGGLGGGSSDCHSANVSVLVRFRGANLPRNFYNWNYLPGIPKDVVTLNTVDSGFLDAIKDGYANLIDLAAVMGPFPAWRWVCTSQEENGSPRTDQLFRAVAAIQIPSPQVTQRRKRAYTT